MVTQLESIKKRLEDERDRLRQEISHLERVGPTYGQPEVGDAYGNHIADVATDTFEQEKTVALESHLRGTLNAVEDALRRLERGTYGLCEVCGRQISDARLEALPYATLCIECKTRQEKEAQRRQV